MGNRLYVGNLSFNSTADTLRTAFSAFGEVTDAHVASDRETGQSRGFGFVTMNSAQEAQKAIASMNGALLDGRAVRVNEAEERPNRGGGGGGGGRGFGGGGGGGGRGGGGGGRDRWLDRASSGPRERSPKSRPSDGSWRKPRPVRRFVPRRRIVAVRRMPS